MVCFAVFTVLMSFAFLAATKFNFKDGDDFNREPIRLQHLKNAKKKIFDKIKGARGAILKEQRVVGEEGEVTVAEVRVNGVECDVVDDVTDDRGVINRPTPFVPRATPAQNGGLPEWVTVIRHFGMYEEIQKCNVPYTRTFE